MARRLPQGILAHAANPPGRGVTPEARARAGWLADLDPESRTWLEQLVSEGVAAGLHKACCLLDGVAAIEDGPDKGHLVLTHVAADGTETRLNPESGEMLHDLFDHHLHSRG
ncbi:hypothetical protein [Mesobacterium pallidum]|uniref:hypothetical protein n=1 Tax=Mesobacterium pallidum TaxID=2872037 RepID=UPI001EE2C44A|nr:hypothetical protein [Mesobacterium pallidum]